MPQSVAMSHSCPKTDFEVWGSLFKPATICSVVVERRQGIFARSVLSLQTENVKVFKQIADI